MQSDIEISKALALAIGWEVAVIFEDRCIVETHNNIDRIKFGNWWLKGRRVFDYRDPDVIWPIAAKFDCFPCRFAGARWGAWVGEYGQEFFADTPEKAVALAVSNRRVRHEHHH